MSRTKIQIYFKRETPYFIVEKINVAYQTTSLAMINCVCGHNIRNLSGDINRAFDNTILNIFCKNLNDNYFNLDKRQNLSRKKKR